jgi:hypothetical protein
MSVSAIAGNENFTLVENAAGVFQNLQTSFEQSVESKIEKLTVYDENFAKEVVGLGTIFTVTGYAPDNFGTTAKNGGVFLNILPQNKPATSVDDKQLLHLPDGARIIAMRITNNGTTITGTSGSTIDIDCQGWTAGAISGNRLANDTPTGAGGATGVNSPAGVKFWPAKHTVTASSTFNYNAGEPTTSTVTTTINGPEMTLGTVGEDQGREDLSPPNSVVVTPTTREVGVLVNNESLTAGDLAVKLWYIAPTEVPGDRP